MNQHYVLRFDIPMQYLELVHQVDSVKIGVVFDVHHQ